LTFSMIARCKCDDRATSREVAFSEPGFSGQLPRIPFLRSWLWRLTVFSILAELTLNEGTMDEEHGVVS
jgi:hypothetical protein